MLRPYRACLTLSAVAYQGWGGSQIGFPQQGRALYHWHCLELPTVLLENRLTKSVLLLFKNSLHTMHHLTVCIQDSEKVGKMRKGQKLISCYYCGQLWLILTGNLCKTVWTHLRTVPAEDMEAGVVTHQLCPPLDGDLRVYAMNILIEPVCFSASSPLKKAPR